MSYVMNPLLSEMEIKTKIWSHYYDRWETELRLNPNLSDDDCKDLKDQLRRLKTLKTASLNQMLDYLVAIEGDEALRWLCTILITGAWKEHK